MNIRVLTSIAGVLLLATIGLGRAEPEMGDMMMPAMAPETAVATFAGGCFWCMEQAMDKVEGVISTTSGFIGGHQAAPTYKQVSGGGTGHTEAVRVVYDPKVVGYEKLLNAFWHNIDPIVPNQQFCDGGSQYRSGIFFHTPEQERLAHKTKGEIEASGRLPGPIVTEITAASAFYPAEEYHQDYYLKNPFRYKVYKYNCGRVKRLEKLWGEEAGHG